MQASALMSQSLITATPTTSVAEIARLLSTHKISAVPVCDPQRRLLGLVTEADILRPLRESDRLRRDWWLGQIAEGEELPAAFLDYLRQDQRQATELMTTAVITATPETTLAQLAELMVQHRVKRLPILQGETLVGIVSRADLIGALARDPALMG